MRHLPQRVVDGLLYDLDFLPQYAGYALRHATVILETDMGPIWILEIQADIWRFDYRGSMRDFMFESIYAGQLTFIRTDGWKGRDREPSPEAIEARKAYEAKHRWTPAPLEINQMIHAIWPKDAGRPVKPPRLVPGITKKRIPMTYEAKEAVRQIHEQNWRLLHTISDLSDKSLKAFRQLVGERQHESAALPGDNSMAALYGDFAAVADGELASRAR